MAASCHGCRRDDSLATLGFPLSRPEESKIMTDAVIAQRSPFPAEVEAGKKYAWCRCGRSATQPYCDGSHKGTGLSPVIFVAEKTETVWLCGCKHTKERPFCDGTHESL
jgi:CDGSH iron-sulfur domain-containing protein 3